MKLGKKVKELRVMIILTLPRVPSIVMLNCQWKYYSRTIMYMCIGTEAAICFMNLKIIVGGAAAGGLM